MEKNAYLTLGQLYWLSKLTICTHEKPHEISEVVFPFDYKFDPITS